MIKIADSSSVNLLLRYIGRAKKVHLASPWIKPEVMLPLKRAFASIKEVDILLSHDPKNLPSIKLLNNVARVYEGPIHAKLYILEDDEKPFISIFGSENLTGSNNLELVLLSDDVQLNKLLLSKYRSFLGYCQRVRI